MPNEKPSQKKKCAISVSIAFENEIALVKPICFERSFQQCSADNVTVSKKGIEITFERARKLPENGIFNKTRIGYIQWTFLLLACLEGVSAAPMIGRISYSQNERPSKVLKDIEGFRCLFSESPNINLPYPVIERCLKRGELAESLRIAISYYWISAKSASQEERLKLLWGAFNALYRWYAKKEGLKSSSELKMLDMANRLFLDKDILDRSVQLFERLFQGEAFKEFVRWKLITGTRSRALHIKKGDSSQSVKDKRNRLRLLDKESLTYMRDIGCGEVEGKQCLKKAINELLPSAKTDKASLRKTCLFICRYIYLFRCDGVHANKVYPIFDANNGSEKQALNDLLEMAIVDFATWIATNDQYKC